MWSSRGIRSLCIFACVLDVFTRCSAASAHIRTHTHTHTVGSSNERTEDGAFSPRDSDHYVDGEHHQEFDHEAILGNFFIHFSASHFLELFGGQTKLELWAFQQTRALENFLTFLKLWDVKEYLNFAKTFRALKNLWAFWRTEDVTARLFLAQVASRKLRNLISFQSTSQREGSEYC